MNAAIDSQMLETGGIGGHPRGLNVLFFTELWERFSYYGMRAILVLFMVAPVVQGGLGFSVEHASEIYGTYTMCVYLTAIPGGFIADRILGARKAILFGGIVIALGHFTMVLPALSAFYGGMLLIVLGTGLLKPNISTMVGRLYHQNDPRRDAGFSIFYMGINMGATLAPIVCGYLAQSGHFKEVLAKLGLSPESSWHFGFAAAGVGMCIGLVHLVMQWKLLDKIGGKIEKEEVAPHDIKDLESDTVEAANRISTKEPAKEPTKGDVNASAKAPHKAMFTPDELKKLGALLCLFVFNALFWSIYEQGGSSLNIFADRLTNNTLFGMSFPSSWFQSLQSTYVILLAPVFSWLWIKLGEKQPSSPGKFSLGLLFLGIGIAVMVPAAILTAQGKVSPIFLIVVYFVETLGELCLSPVGLSTVTKLAPARLASLTMGGWFVSTAIGNRMAGHFSGYLQSDSSGAMSYLFGAMAIAALTAAGLLAALTPFIKKLMGSVR
ncbi:peptide MFS transporter [bacterium]|nr:peptide MFS transporter [bacterium]MBP9807809.1 peptide MFS transporter [bacterium]